jgi:hypothetical protein
MDFDKLFNLDIEPDADVEMVKAREIYEGGVELFVEDGTTPTFEELKEYVKKYKYEK